MAREERVSENGPRAFHVFPEEPFVVADSHCSRAAPPWGRIPGYSAWQHRAVLGFSAGP